MNFIKRKMIVLTLFSVTAFEYTYGIGEEIGNVYKVDEGKRDVYISMKNGQMMNIGERLQVEADNGKLVLEVTFHMQTLSKCKINGKVKLSRLLNKL